MLWLNGRGLLLELPAHDTAWESKFVLPLAEFMKQRGAARARGSVRWHREVCADSIQ